DRLFRDSKHHSITEDQVQAAGADRENVLHFNPVVLRLNHIGRNLRDGRRIGGTRWSERSGSDSALADSQVTHDASVGAGAGLPVTFGSTGRDTNEAVNRSRRCQKQQRPFHTSAPRLHSTADAGSVDASAFVGYERSS